MNLSLGAGRVLREWIRSRSPIERVSLAILAALLITFAIQGLFESDGSLEEVQDHIITHSLSRQVVDHGLFFRDFVYPLPAIVFKALLGELGEVTSSFVWSILSIVCGLWLAWALVVLTGNERNRRALLAPLLAVISLTWCVQWDYGAVNSNMVFLAAVVGSGVWSQRGRPGWAGLLLASSIALKLYSAPLLVYWLFVGRSREVIWTLLWCMVYFALIPALYFGPEQAVHLTGLWLDRLLASRSPEFGMELIGYRVSLQSVWFEWTGPEGLA
ncbi:MAG: glycosyltransferase family 87 protein, partial [Myxococcota bacterium]